jgi:hypothetical protein
VIIAWRLTKTVLNHIYLGMRPTPAAPGNVGTDTLHFQTTAGPQIARCINAMASSTDGGLMVWIE